MAITGQASPHEGDVRTVSRDMGPNDTPNASMVADLSTTVVTDSPTDQEEDTVEDAQVHSNSDDEDDTQDEEDSDNDSENDTWARDHLNREALQHIATYFLPGNHGKCVSIAPFSSGGYHHVEVLEFEDGWSCIGRFGYDRHQPLGMDEAEVATMQYVARHTSIPVPAIYYVNHNHNHVVGAAFVLMQKLPGTCLWELWDELSILHKKAALSQIAGVVVQLASLKFDRIGSLTASGDVGPLFQEDFNTHNGPFDTLEDAFYGMIDASPSASCCAECQEYCRSARHEVEKLFGTQTSVLDLCKAPFSLLHGDFTAGNMLFSHDDPDCAPVFHGLIDFDGSGTSPFYYHYDHSGLLTTDDWREPESHASNKELRKHYVRSLARHFPLGSKERHDVHRCFRMKSYFLDQFVLVFPMYTSDHLEQQAQMREFLVHLKDGTGAPRGNVMNWRPDSDSELDEEEVDGSDSDDEGELKVGDEEFDTITAGQSEEEEDAEHSEEGQDFDDAE